MKATPYQKAFDELRALGLVLQQAPGHYRVNFRHGTTATEYQTDDLFDAVEQGRIMALNPPPPPDPPPGRTRSRSPGKAVMFAHNNRVEARRMKRRAKEGRG